MAVRTLSLFAGGGGLDLGVHLAVPDARTVCYVEREAYAASTLVARMEESSLAPAPIWSDVTTFRGRPWRGAVDLIVGGFPCQDVSNAGKRAGLDGARSGLWFEYARIIDEVRPRAVFIENVSALVGRGLDRVLESLAALGFDAEWDCFRASDVGAPHRRERIFILAHAAEQRAQSAQEAHPGARPHLNWFGGRGEPVAHAVGEQLRYESGRSSGSGGAGAGLVGNSRTDVGYTACELHQRVSVGHGSSESRSAATVGELGYPDGAGLEGWNSPVDERADEWCAWPPGPAESDCWREFLRLRSDLEPSVCGGAHGLAGGLEHRTDRLRLLGNGVVPQVAALAFRVLYERLIS